MNKHPSLSNLSTDSLEQDLKNTSIRDGSDANVDTILVPFYENDVLIKVPKELKRRVIRDSRSSDRNKMEANNSSYLVNKRKARRTTYLEMFRKQLTPSQKTETKPSRDEIRSLSPEYGDTERESITEDVNNAATEFYNTESYNEIYYEKLLNQELEQYLVNSFDDADDAGQNKLPHNMLIENLKSVSEISQARPRMRRTTIPPLDNVKLGGLGPDMEQIKPRLERARSLQRYSEKVRMENRLRIYKKSVQVENDKKDEKENSEKKKNSKSVQHTGKIEPSASYLINKTTHTKPTPLLNKLYGLSKSADVKRSRNHNVVAPIKNQNKPVNKPNEGSNLPSANDKRNSIPNGDITNRAKSSTTNRAINTEKHLEVPPVQINFMVNVGGIRPSSALRTLEEKHRIYQEKVKAFKMQNNNL